MRAVLALCIALATAGQAAAAGAGGEPGTNVEMPFLIAPLSLDGKLTGYAYISSKVVTTTHSAALDVRSKIPFIQDAFVRDVNAAPIGTATDPRAIDKKVLVARLLADVRRIIGAAKIADITIVQIQISELHPNEALAATPPE